MELFTTIFSDLDSLKLLTFRYLLDIVFTTVLILGVYYRLNKKTTYLFNFFIFNTLIFFVASLLSKVSLDTGFAFGLFAIFSILRYRTIQIPIKEMSYLFIAIVIATINSTVTLSLSYGEVIFANLVILGICFLMEKIWARSFKESQIVKYEKIELIKPENRDELFLDLEDRIGRSVNDVEIQAIDFLTDSAKIKVYFNH